MNVYHVSYDVSEDDNEKVLVSLIRTLRKTLLATNIIRPVRSTLRFSTEKDYASVYAAITTWAGEESVCYFFSKVEPSVNDGKFYYWMQQNPKLKAGVDEKIKAVDAEK